MNPKCYKSAILPFLGRGSHSGKISHIEGGFWMHQLAGILGLLAIEAPIYFQPVTHRFRDFDPVSSKSSGIAGDDMVRITGFPPRGEVNRDQWQAGIL